MSSDYSRTVVDPWSRFVSYCGLVVALGTLAWAYFGHDSLLGLAGSGANSDVVAQQVNELFEQETVARKQLDERMRAEMRDAWHDEQKNQLAAYKVAADGMLREHKTLMTQMTSTIQPATFTSNVDSPDTSDDGDENDSTNITDLDETFSTPILPPIDNAKPADELPADLGPGAIAADDSADDTTTEEADGSASTASAVNGVDQNEAPLLAVVRESHKTDGTIDTPRKVVIHNRGKRPAIITHVEFMPSIGGVFAIEPSMAIKVEPDTTSVVFTAEDNRSNEKSTNGVRRHGIYARDLAETVTVPVGQDVRFRLAVANPQHKGYALRGKLKVEYNYIEPLVIDDAELVFVDPEVVVTK